MPDSVSSAALDLLHPDARRYAQLANLSTAEARYASILYDALARCGVQIPREDRSRHQAIIDAAVLCRRIAEQQQPAPEPAPARPTTRAAAPLDPLAAAGLPRDLVSVPQAAQLAGIHARSIYKLICDHKVDAYGSPPRLRISLSALLPQRQFITPRIPRRSKTRTVRNTP